MSHAFSRIEVMATGVLDRLEEELAELCGHVNALNASIVRVVAAAMDAGGWHGPGLHSPAHWVAWKTAMSTAHAQRLMRLVERRGELPVAFAAFEAGELSIDQVAPIVERVPAYADAQVCEFARSATVTQLRRVVRAYPFPPDPRQPEKQPTPRGASLSWSQGDDGRWWLRGELERRSRPDRRRRPARSPRRPLRRAGGDVECRRAGGARRTLLRLVTSAGRRGGGMHVHIAADGQMRDPFGGVVDAAFRGQLLCDAIWRPT
jgi:Domain of unknown function (DUF222)